MHTAWVSAAAVVNVSMVARAYDVPHQYQLGFGLVAAGLAALSGCSTSLGNDDPVYGIVTGWAMLSIALNPAVVNTTIHAPMTQAHLNMFSQWCLLLGCSALGCSALAAVSRMCSDKSTKQN